MGCFGSHGSASLWISWDVLAVSGQHITGAQGAALVVKGQHPFGFHGMFWQSWVSIPVDFMGCFDSQGSVQYRCPGGSTGSQGSASLWISWDVLTVRGQHNTGAQGAALAVKGQHPCGFHGIFGSQGSASLWISWDVLAVRGQHPCGFQGVCWQSEVSTLWGPGVSTGSQGSAHYRAKGSVLAVRGQHIMGAQGSAMAVRGQHVMGAQGSALAVRGQHIMGAQGSALTARTVSTSSCWTGGWGRTDYLRRTEKENKRTVHSHHVHTWLSSHLITDPGSSLG